MELRPVRDQLVTLYNKAMGSQWNSVTELDWDTEVDPEAVVDRKRPAAAAHRRGPEVDGSPIAAWGDKELLALGVESFKAQLSQFMHGEQGAMMTAAKIVETVPWIDAKYYAAPRRWTRPATPRCSPSTSTPSWARPTP